MEPTNNTLNLLEVLAHERNHELQIYVHVPFCKSRCAYCDFYTFEAKPDSPGLERYCESLKLQVDTLLSQKRHKLRSLYFGGGTPSLLGSGIADLVSFITEKCDISEGCEITVEANPESCTIEFIQECKEAGVNRISLGVQAFSDEVLRLLTRSTYLGQVRYAIKLLNNENMSFSLDLIAGIPGVSEKDWRSWVIEAAHTGAQHISIYPLSIEEGTPLQKRIESGEVEPPDEDISADQLLIAQEILENEGLKHYEISNYALPGYRAIHNTGYWEGVPYLGVGPHASSMLYGQKDGDIARYRFMLHEGLAEFFAKPEITLLADFEELVGAQLDCEDVMLALRLFDGVDAEMLASMIDPGTLEKFIHLKILEKTNNRYSFSKTGWLLGNEVFEAVWQS